MFVKICGVRDVATAIGIAEAGASAIGLNFYARSPRCVSDDTARDICRALPHGIGRVGVFVNHSADEVSRIVREVGLTAVQFHGDETPEVLRAVRDQHPQVLIYRAWRMKVDGLTGLADHLVGCSALQVYVNAVLLDAHSPEAYGGTGKRLPWEQVSREYDIQQWPRLILAGGLSPDNVADAIRTVHPWGVDTASGVESAPGVKDLERVQDFIVAARTGRPNP